VLASFRDTAAQHGYPASTLTDNGMVYTVRFAGGRGGRTSLEHELRRRNIVQKNSRPNHPTTCGKVERFQQTLKKWLRAQPVQPTTIAELQALLDTFRQTYNQRRPHRSLPHRCTPATAYTAGPKATPSADRSNQTMTGSASTTLAVDRSKRHLVRWVSVAALLAGCKPGWPPRSSRGSLQRSHHPSSVTGRGTI